ncbi:MAG TPA: PAS domain S-box protein [Ramlibacter sp.]|nr:PAS domain S-box protein [Ramlibacter sp.]
MLIAIAPVFAVVLQASLEEQRGRLQRTETALRSLVELDAAHQARLIEGARQMLTAMAHAPPVYQGDLAACVAYMKKLQVDYPAAYGTFGLLDAQGQLACRATPPALLVSSADRRYFRNAISTGRFSVGEFTVSRASGRSVLPVGLPVYGGEAGQLRGVVYVALDLAQAEDHLRKLTIPPETTLTVVDADGIALAATGPSAVPAGTRLRDDFLLRAIATGSARDGRADGADGQEWLFAVRPVGRAGEGRVYVTGMASTSAVLAPAASRLQMQLGALVLITLLGAVAAWIFGDRIVARPIAALLARVDALAREELRLDQVPAPTGLPRLAELAELDRRVQELARRLVERSVQRDGAMAEMLHQKNLLESVLESMAEGLLVLDRRGRVLHRNDASVRLLPGVGQLQSDAGLLRRRPAAWGVYLLDGSTPCPPRQWPPLRALRGEGTGGFRYLVRGPLSGGTEKVVQGSARPVRTPDGRLAGAVILFSDATDAWRAEQALKDSEQRYRTLFESNPHPMWVYDVQTLAFLTVNDAAVAHYGYSREEFLRMSIADIRPPQEVESLMRVLEHTQTLSQPRPWLHRRKDGSCIDVEISSHVLDYGGRRARMVLALDITLRLRAEEALRQVNETLERRVGERTAELKLTNRELESFSYSVSHDLRAPLQVIDGFGRALLAHHAHALDAQARHYLERIRDNTRQMGELIDALLSLARVTRVELRTERIDLSALAVLAIERLRQRWPERQVEVEIEPGLASRGDPRLLAALLDNLIENAWKFTSRNAQARIRVGRKAASKGEVVFFVEDNGAGFDMSYVDKLFKAFQRLHSVGEFEGTGIGLATVHRIVARHGGRVWAESSPGRGAVFHFILQPGAPDEEQPYFAGRGQPRSPGTHPDDVDRQQCAQ